MESIHGRALLKIGLIVAPSCDDCHGVHNIKRAVDRDSPINHANVAKTCGNAMSVLKRSMIKASMASYWPKVIHAGRCVDAGT